MYCDIERNIMKNQAGSPSFGMQGKSLCICVLCVMLSHYLFYVFYNLYAGNFYTGLKPTYITISTNPREFFGNILSSYIILGHEDIIRPKEENIKKC